MANQPSIQGIAKIIAWSGPRAWSGCPFWRARTEKVLSPIISIHSTLSVCYHTHQPSAVLPGRVTGTVTTRSTKRLFWRPERQGWQGAKA